MEKLISPIASTLGVNYAQVKNTLDLLAEGNTIPFIARYRKEVTKGLDEEQIRYIDEQYQYQKNLAKRKEDVKRLIETQGKITPELIAQIDACETLAGVEDIYRPYMQKRKTRATDAIAKGLKPLAEWILTCPITGSLDDEAAKYVNENVSTLEEAIQGAKDILAESVSDEAQLRRRIREYVFSEAKIVVKLKKNAVDEEKTYRVYYAYSERVSTLAAHRVMAIDRGEREKILDVGLEYNRERFAVYQLQIMTQGKETIVKDTLDQAIRDGLKRLVFPAIEREVRSQLTDKAQEKSIDVFSSNLERLLSQAPIKGSIILGVDPAYRTGCKLAVIDETGKLLHIDVIYPHPPVNKKNEAIKKTIDVLDKYNVNLIAIGNGTASRETEAFIAEILRTTSANIRYAMVSEAGASVYSAGDLAREEFPQLHVEERSAVSIARRLLDPLSELIKIDPKSIGVGQYQHDLAEARLQERLDFAVVKTVNRVGADANTASEELLRHIAGLNKNVAKSLVSYRNENGHFTSRNQLMEVKGLGAKAYTQAAGFLRIPKGIDELDRTAIHPESYDLTRRIMRELNIRSLEDENRGPSLANADAKALAERLNSDVYTVKDILSILSTPFRDYRDRFDGPLLHSDIVKIEDLKVGLSLEGTVRNVTDFGAFVDIGLKNDGLVHVSKLSKERIFTPYEKVSVGDIVTVTVIGIDYERNKVSLSMIEQ
ncbi:MAG TPA: RNA-binding transcriptional accessory protein [Erysipelotrichaceae bacterium]|nr:RNA-binding transcriptional accessory protein [Erysipelotrichaceae bacterium]HAO62101.1 RNA-binding transcriptional accessory protein [Erysipelotrichaceae bacterium]HBZ40665.1 RNA-binding transcriptional accessory protein [Erysipelotrichaceae bacterium]